MNTHGTMKQRRDGTWGHTQIVGNDARLLFDPTFAYGSWNVYRPDGMYAKKVMTFATEQAAVEFIQNNKWDLVR